MREPSRFRRSRSRPGASEVYSAAIVVAITLALSGAAYALADFHVAPIPVYTVRAYSLFGNPSILRIQVNSSSPSTMAEIRIDNASSLSGLLALTTKGYSTTSTVCSPAETTFFGVSSEAGTISVSGAVQSWIDGVQESSATVSPGLHELIVEGGTSCVVGLPGGVQLSGPSPAISSFPAESSSSRSFVILVPYFTGGHTATMTFSGGTSVIGF